MSDNKEIIRKRVCFYGRVQSVGFRYKALCAARWVKATGWVRNELNGSVTMEIQGTERQVNDVIAEIDSDKYIRIERMETVWLDPVPDERDFRVRR
ncbi:MAG: acylphosphatase [Clostridia bacterium]|jgi:acylphosphatase|nr:acylphosphatase [Clostridia bacterium]MBQ1440726.1 acylphosphatase [Clostridia bacterium]